MAVKLFGLTETEAQLIRTLRIGEALWLVGGRSFRVQHVVSDIEAALVKTDRAMLDSQPTALDRQAADTIPTTTNGECYGALA